MEYEKIINLLDNASNQPSKFRTKNWIEINDQSRVVYNTNSDIRFEITMLKSNLCAYNDAYILVKGRITITGARNDVAARRPDERNKGVIFKNCASFIICKSEINNIEINNAKDIDIVMTMYNLIEYSDNYSKTSENLWLYYRDKPNDNLADTKSFRSKIKITENTPAGGNTKAVEPISSLKYLSNFWRTLEMPLINCEINLILTCSSTCVIINSTGAGRFAISDTKLYVPVVTLSTQDSAKLLQQLKFRFQRTISWNKYQSDPKAYAQNQYSTHLVDSSFQGVYRLIVLSFENENGRTAHTGYYLPKLESKDYSVKVDGKNLLDQPVNNDKITYENIRKIATGQGDDYTTGCLLDYPYFKENYKMILLFK